MPSRTIRPTEAPVAAPYTYTVAAPEGFAPEAVFAQWDGGSAIQDFRPCVSYYNAEGVLLDRAFPADVVAAGDAAEVGYRPFERGTSATAKGLTVESTFVEVDNTKVLFIDPPLTLIDAGGGTAELGVAITGSVYATGHNTDFGAVAVAPNTPLPFTTDASVGVTVAADHWTIVTAGMYRWDATVNVSVPGAHTSPVTLEFQAAAANTLQEDLAFSNDNVTVGVGAFLQRAFAIGRLAHFSAGDVIRWQHGAPGDLHSYFLSSFTASLVLVA